MSHATKVTREEIENHIRKINQIENNRPNSTVEETLSALNELFPDNAEVWLNGQHIPNKQALQENDRLLFTIFDDYHRDIEHLIIDPPFASFSWCIRSAKHNMENYGCSVVEINDSGLAVRAWVYCDPAPVAKILMQKMD